MHFYIFLIFSTCRSFPYSWLITRGCQPFRSTWVDPRFSVGVRLARSLVLCIVFCGSSFGLSNIFFFGQCVVLLFTDSEYPVGILKLFVEYSHAFSNKRRNVYTSVWVTCIYREIEENVFVLLEQNILLKHISNTTKTLKFKVRVA